MVIEREGPRGDGSHCRWHKCTPKFSPTKFLIFSSIVSSKFTIFEMSVMMLSRALLGSLDEDSEFVTKQPPTLMTLITMHITITEQRFICDLNYLKRKNNMAERSFSRSLSGRS